MSLCIAAQRFWKCSLLFSVASQHDNDSLMIEIHFMAWKEDLKELRCAPIKCSATHCAVHVAWIRALSLHRYLSEVSVIIPFSDIRLSASLMAMFWGGMPEAKVHHLPLGYILLLGWRTFGRELSPRSLSCTPPHVFPTHCFGVKLEVSAVSVWPVYVQAPSWLFTCMYLLLCR